MKPEDINYILNIVPNFSYGRRQGLSDEDTIRKSNQVWHELEDALEKQVAKNSKEMTWEHFIKSMQMNSYEIEHEMLDPEDNSVAGDEIISVVPQSFVLGLMYSIAQGNTIILPPE